MANQHWYKPNVVKRTRMYINGILILIALLMLYLNHMWLFKFIQQIISNI